MTRVPFLDLKEQSKQIGAEVQTAIAGIIEDASGFILGEEVKSFEAQYAAFVGVRHCVGVGNGTDALELGLRALEVGPGDEVIVPANSFVASALSVVRAGARPVLADCDAVHHMIDVRDAERRVTERTRAIMPVHLYGDVAPMKAVLDFAAGAGLRVIEDAAQAHGALQNGKAAGTFGDVAATSFYPTKNLGAYGDGGAVLTSDDALATRLRNLRNYGSEQKYHHPEIGFNSRLDTIQAAVLSIKLEYLAEWNEARRVAAARYDTLLRGVAGLRLPQRIESNVPVHHLYVVRVARRAEVIERLAAAGIGVAVHYPTPIHLHRAFAFLDHRVGDFPNAEAASRDVLSLPMFPEITEEQQTLVSDEIKQALR
jgi:dTDP-4-amino-4,6-dideoxygalactose transaminase